MLIEIMWCKIREILEQYAKKICSDYDGVMYAIGNNANEVFLLRGYLSFMKDKNGDEIAITIDVKNRINFVAIESGIYTGDGRIIAEGPQKEEILTEEILEL